MCAEEAGGRQKALGRPASKKQVPGSPDQPAPSGRPSSAAGQDKGRGKSGKPAQASPDSRKKDGKGSVQEPAGTRRKAPQAELEHVHAGADGANKASRPARTLRSGQAR